MANRNNLHIHQSGDPMGVTYNVYRSDTPDVSDASRLIAVVNEANAVHTALQQVGERLVQDTKDPFTWYTSKVYEEQPGFTLYSNGKMILPAYVTGKPSSKVFTLDRAYDVGGSIVTADYWFLAVEMIDDTKLQPGVNYFGPIAKSLNAPVNFNMAYDFTTYKMSLSWAIDLTPKTFYYAIKSIDKSGYISPVSGEQHISLSTDIPTTKYMIEKSTKLEGPWFAAATVAAANWTDPDASIGGHIPVQFTSTHVPTVATLSLINPWYDWQSNWRSSYFYRVSCIDDLNERGPTAPNLPFYKGVNIKPLTYILRRKKDNGTPATLDGVDAITLRTWKESDVNVTQRLLTYEDSALVPDIYGYTTYVIDERGMVGQPFYSTVDMR